jgi:hypothetical protein
VSAPTKSALARALKLPANDRAALVEKLVLSLNKPDASLDADCLKEDRLAACRAGDLAAVDADKVFSDLGKRT